jgi:hypothetical protein
VKARSTGSQAITRPLAATAKVKLRAAVVLVENEHGRAEIAMPPGDAQVHEARLLTGLGTPSRAFAKAELQRLIAISRTAPGGDPDADAVNAGLALIDGIDPRNEHEAVLAAQLAAAHVVAMEAAAKARYALAAFDPVAAKDYGAVAARLMRSTARLTEALVRLRRGGIQQVIVQHVSVSDGGQVAILNAADPTRGDPPK